MKPILSIPYGTLNSPEFATNPIAPYARAARSVACLATSPNPLGSSNPFGALRDAIRKGWGCDPPPAPQEPQPVPTPEGKCKGTIYIVTAVTRYEAKVSGNRWEPRESTAGGGGYRGIISNIVGNGQQGTQSWFLDSGQPGDSWYSTRVNFANTQNDSPDLIRGASTTISITPAPGQPQVCPTPEEPTYPTFPPRGSPDSPVSPVIPPVIVIPVSPTVNVPVKVDVNISVNGNVNVRIGNQIDFNFNAGGIDVYINPTANIDLFPDAPAPGYELPPGYPDEPTGNGGNDGDEFGAINDQLDEVRELLEALKDCACDVETANTFVTVAVDDANNGSVLLGDDVIAVQLVLVRFPNTPKLEWGGGEAPDVYYAGWSSFTSFGAQGERTPIDYLSKIFFRKNSDSAFTWTCRQFYSARVSLIRRTPITPP
jgi:hypothetical protein